MTLEDVKKKGMFSEIVRRLSNAENNVRQLLIQSPAFPGARVYNNANQSIPNNTNTPLTFNTVTFDQGAFWNAATPTRLTISVPGVYYINGAVRFAASNTVGRGLAIRVDGVTDLCWVEHGGQATYNIAMIACTIYPLTAGQYVEIVAWQGSGLALNSLNSGIDAPLAMIQRLS